MVTDITYAMFSVLVPCLILPCIEKIVWHFFLVLGDITGVRVSHIFSVSLASCQSQCSSKHFVLCP